MNCPDCRTEAAELHEHPVPDGTENTYACPQCHTTFVVTWWNNERGLR